MDEVNKKLLIRYGSAASEAMFDFPCKFFHHPECSGVIAYRDVHHCAIVIGDPICPPSETFLLAKAFEDYCEKQNLNIIYIIISEIFSKWTDLQGYKIKLEVCEELIFDLEADPLQASHRIKHRVDKATKHGLTVHEYIPTNLEIENSLKELGTKWQHSIKGPNVFLGHLNFFESYTGKRWFYVKEEKTISSMLMLSKLDAQNGWLLKFLIISPNAFHGTSEFLVCTVWELLKKENYRVLTKGMLPKKALGNIEGLTFFNKAIANFFYQIISWIFKFQKRKEYWLRYNPKERPAFLVFKNSHVGLNEIKALIQIFRNSLIN